MSSQVPEPSPTFRALKDALRKRGFDWERRQIFPNEDLYHGVFKGTSDDGRNVSAPADYEDNEQIEPEIVDNICRGLGIDARELVIDCDDGRKVSVRPARRVTPPDRPALGDPNGKN